MPIDLDFLRSLSEAFGPPGGEGPVRDMLRLYLKDRVDEVWSDRVGNLFALKRAKDPRPPSPSPTRGEREKTAARVLVTAHMDEAGLMVMQIGGNGLLSVRAAGKIEARGLLGQVVHIGADRVPGVIGVGPVHLVSAKARENLPELDDISIDIGADSRDEAASAVKRGDYAVPATAFGRVGHLLKGKALDNRAGMAVALALLDFDYPCALYLAFTVQEGVGARGARVATYTVQPDLALVLDGVGVDELPDEEDPPPPYNLGGGPILVLADRGVLLDRGLTERLQAVAAAEGIPYQVLASRDEGSDARTIQAARLGVPTALVGLPLRYPHLPVTLAHPADLEHTLSLLKTFLDLDRHA